MTIDILMKEMKPLVFVKSKYEIQEKSTTVVFLEISVDQHSNAIEHNWNAFVIF